MKPGSTRVVVVAALTVLPSFWVTHASAGDCPTLDPTCVVDYVVEGESGVVEDTVDTATDTIDPVVDDTIDEVTGPPDGGEPPPDSDGGGSGGGSGDGNTDGGGSDRGTGPAGGGPAIGTSTPSGTGVESTSSTSTVPAAHQPAERPRFSERLAAAAAGAAKSLAVVFVLMGAVIGFVLVQNQLDKKDPRLALAPMRSEIVRFD